MAKPPTSPFHVMHALRMEPLMAGSPKAILALAILDRADPDPVPARTFREAFDCTPPEVSHTLAKLRERGLVVRDGKTASYRMTVSANALRRRIGGLLSGEELAPLPAAATRTGSGK